MSEKLREYREVQLDSLIPFQLRTAQLYQGERLEQLMDSIERNGLRQPIVVRPVDGIQYEIICGHNRANAMKKLGRDTILAEVMDGLSDDVALGLFYDTNLNQQSFHDWNYSQKIKAIQYTENLIKQNSRQGRRSDLTKENIEEGTSVQSRHKSEEKSRRSTTRDRMAHRLGIATATLSKYRSIIKLPDDVIKSLAKMLDERKITFEVAYRLSRFNTTDAKMLVEFIEKSSSRKVDLEKLKELCVRRKEPGEGKFLPMLTRDEMNRVLVAEKSKPILPVTHQGK